MFDQSLVLELLRSIRKAAERIRKKMKTINGPEDFYASEGNKDILDVLCMQLSAIGEGLKQVDKLTDAKLLVQYPQVDWKGLKGIRDVIAHQYFDLSSEAVFETCQQDIPILLKTVKTIIKDIS